MKREAYIFKRLKEHYKEIDGKYEIVGLFLQGSQNYGLDIYDDDYKSDIDTKAIVLPTLKDIVMNAPPISTTLVLENNEHIDLKDIRVMFDTFKKQNVNFIEILFTKFRLINPKYKDLWKKLTDKREDIARLDYNKALNCQCGMSEQKYVALKHPYPTIADKIDKFGYDPKQLHHILRMNDFIKKYVKGKSYEECLVPDNKERLIEIKKGVLPLEEAEILAKELNEETYRIAQQNKSNEPIKQEAVDLLDEVKFEAMERFLKDALQEKEEAEAEKTYGEIFVTSDIHFSHENILQFENRPFNDVKEMDETIIKRWNSVVSPNDLVYILGDVSFASVKHTNELIKRLNGDKILIKGNHDEFIYSEKFDKTLFKSITSCLETEILGERFIMCHYPFASNDCHKVQLFGHIHSNTGIHAVEKLPSNALNVCMDANNLTPVNIKEIIKRINDEKLKDIHK